MVCNSRDPPISHALPSWITGTWIALEETDTKYEMKEISLYGAGGKVFTVFAIYDRDSTTPGKGFARLLVSESLIQLLCTESN